MADETDTNDTRAALPPIAVALLIGATGWFLLQQLAPLLRPLLMAVFLCYVIVPTYHRVRQRFPGPMAYLIIAGTSVGAIYLLSMVLQENIVALEEQMPRLTKRAQEIIADLREFAGDNLPWLTPSPEESARLDAERVKHLKEAFSAVLNMAAGVFLDVVVVGIYLLFLLLEANRLPNRLRSAFAGARGDNILGVVGKINDAIAGYLRVKVKASLILAVPLTLILWVFGVNLPVLWGLLNFFCNFIPYLGSIVGFSVPALFTFLDRDLGWQPIAAVSLVLALHLLMAYVIEPRMTGKAVGLSPLVILISLSFWGLCWGFIGMFLATPLTVIVKLVLDNIPTTQPIARMLGDE